MTIKLDGGTGFFTINDATFPIGQYRILKQGDNVGLTEQNVLPIVKPAPFTDWRDSVDGTYANRAALITDLESKIYS